VFGFKTQKLIDGLSKVLSSLLEKTAALTLSSATIPLQSCAIAVSLGLGLIDLFTLPGEAFTYWK